MTQKSFDLVRDARQKTLLVAHRGISGGNIPCNTIAAFDAALADGADMIELDVSRSLDGTLYVSRDGQPYMVFCHEWVQIQQGTICAVALSDDLREPIGEPQLLIRASDAHWEHPRKDMMVTDGPFLHRSADGSLLMIWSSFTKDNRYVTVVCRSDNGEIDGKWSYLPGFLCQGDSGHGMLFTDKNGQLTLSLHSPNNSPDERPVFHAVREDQTKGLILL